MNEIYEEIERLRKENNQLRLENEGLHNELDNRNRFIIETTISGDKLGTEEAYSLLRQEIGEDRELNDIYENHTGIRLGFDEDEDANDDE